MSEHTPWRLQTRHHGASDTNEVIIQEGQREVLRIGGDEWDISDFLSIVIAVNSHEKLLEAARKALKRIEGDIETSRRKVHEGNLLRVAIAKAEGRES